MMLADGVCRFCEDLEVDPADVIMVSQLHQMLASVASLMPDLVDAA